MSHLLARLSAVLLALVIAGGLTSCRESNDRLAAEDRQARAFPGDRDQAARSAEPAPTAELPAGAATLRVMSWNLQWFFDNETGDNFSALAKEQSAPSRQAWNWKRDAVAEAIAAADPEIAGFQEIEGRRAIWYLSRALLRDHDRSYEALCIEGTDVFTEQDVGFLYRSSSDTVRSVSSGVTLQPLGQTLFGNSSAMRSSGRYEDVSKHLAVTFEVRLGDAVEHLTIMNVHLRAGAEANEIRIKQARSAHAWLADRIAAGENVILLGDFNTDTTATAATASADLAAATGSDTRPLEDDLVDLHRFLAEDQRQTHLLPGKAFDRILVSGSLLRDDPDRLDLSLAKVQRLKELSVRGETDSPGEHFDPYWRLDEAERDISDHWPIMASFDFK